MVVLLAVAREGLLKDEDVDVQPGGWRVGEGGADEDVGADGGHVVEALDHLAHAAPPHHTHHHLVQQLAPEERAVPLRARRRGGVRRRPFVAERREDAEAGRAGDPERHDRAALLRTAHQLALEHLALGEHGLARAGLFTAVGVKRRCSQLGEHGLRELAGVPPPGRTRRRMGVAVLSTK